MVNGNLLYDSGNSNWGSNNLGGGKGQEGGGRFKNKGKYVHLWSILGGGEKEIKPIL